MSAGNVNTTARKWSRQRDGIVVPGGWPDVLVDLDLNYWADPIACGHEERPSHRDLARTYGWTESRTYRYVTAFDRSTSEAPVKHPRSTREAPDTGRTPRTDGARSTREAPAKHQGRNGEALLRDAGARSSLVSSSPVSDHPSPQPPPRAGAGEWSDIGGSEARAAASERTAWVAARAAAILEGAEEPGELAARYARGDVDMVGRWLRQCRPQGGAGSGDVWLDAPSGLKEREIRAGLRRAALPYGPPSSERPPVYRELVDEGLAPERDDDAEAFLLGAWEPLTAEFGDRAPPLLDVVPLGLSATTLRLGVSPTVRRLIPSALDLSRVLGRSVELVPLPLEAA